MRQVLSDRTVEILFRCQRAAGAPPQDFRARDEFAICSDRRDEPDLPGSLSA